MKERETVKERERVKEREKNDERGGERMEEKERMGVKEWEIGYILIGVSNPATVCIVYTLQNRNNIID